MGALNLILISLAVLTSLACMVLLFRAYAASGVRLLLWSGLCFVFLSLNNVLLFLDLGNRPATVPAPRRTRRDPVSSLRIHPGGRMIAFLSGAVTMGSVIACPFFLRFWRKTSDRFFLAFAVAFLLLALNQALAQWIGGADERAGYAYLLRVTAFALILVAIIDKNLSGRR